MYKTPTKPTYAGAFPWGAFGVQLACAGAGFMIATQYAAHRFGEQAALGPPLFHVVGTSIYAPWNWVVWIWKFKGIDSWDVRAVLVTMLAIVFGAAFGGALMGKLIRAVHTRRQSENSDDLHGSAKFATKKDLEKARLLGNQVGLFIGGWHDAKGKMLRYLRHIGPESVSVIAPPRSGKGVSLVNPILLDHASNALVHDTKKELYDLSAGYRTKELGQRCLLFSPTEPGTCGYNPFAEIRLGTDREVADAQNIVNMLVRTVEENGHNKHWLDVAESFGLGMTIHQCYAARLAGRMAAPIDTYQGLTPFGMTLREYLETCLNFEHDPDGRYGWMTPEGLPTRTHPLVRQKFIEQLNRSEEEFTSVVSELGTAFLVYSDPLVARATSRSDFLMQDLMNFNRPLTVYVAVPPSDKKRLRPLIRLMFTLAIMRNTERMDTSRPSAGPHERLLLMVDEAGSLGKMDILNDALAYMPGYHIQAYLIFHSVEQIQDIYGAHNNILGATGVRIAFAPNTIDTAKLLSAMTGETTIARASYSFSGNRSSLYGPKQMSGHTDYVKRALLTPDEVLRLRGIQKVMSNGEEMLLPGDMLMFVPNQPPIFGTQMLYLADPEFVRRSRIKLDKSVAAPVSNLKATLESLSKGGAHAVAPLA